MPAEYLEVLPDLRRDMGKASVKKLDLAGHGQLVRELIADWKLRQGNAFSRGVPAVLRAVADIASERANLMAWQDVNAGPVILTRDEMLVGLHRAVSVERRTLYGPLRARSDGAVWWQQISTILQQWGFEAIWDDWNDTRFSTQPRIKAPSDQNDLEL